jgi:pimeloyl-ACP methyl ester carboxylesterase
MASQDPATDPAFTLRSGDGVPIAVWSAGEGPAVVLVHGSIADHTTFDALLEELARDFTTYALDRRGFGASGDGASYSIEQDFDDVDVVVAEAARRSGAPVTLWGHSYGANCAMGGAARSDRVSHLVLYEPSLGLPYPAGSIERIEEALVQGDREEAIRRVFVDILELSDEEIEQLRSTPLWATRVAAAHTIPRECRVEQDWAYLPEQFDGITAPTLLLSGSESVPSVIDATRAAASAIPDARVRVLEGHAHFAHKTDPALVGAIVREFVGR